MKQLRENVFLFNLDLKYDKDKIYNMIVEDHKNYHYQWQSNFHLDNKYKNFKKTLYQEFLNKSEELFGKLELLPHNSQECFAFIRNKNDGLTHIHNHLPTKAVINGVYYFNIPVENSGNINFYDDDMNLIHIHFPKENELLIFPGHLNHKPINCDSEKYRISINMEIACKV